jgi:chaperonin cofactor prefoldin
MKPISKQLNDALSEYYLLQGQIRTLQQQSLDVWRRISHLENKIRKKLLNPKRPQRKTP